MLNIIPVPSLMVFDHIYIEEQIYDWASILRNYNFMWGITWCLTDFTELTLASKIKPNTSYTEIYVSSIWKKKLSEVHCDSYHARLLNYLRREFITVRNSYLTRMEKFRSLSKKANSPSTSQVHVESTTINITFEPCCSSALSSCFTRHSQNLSYRVFKQLEILLN